MTIPIVRKRAKRPKTHTGCITCRARHIKCDEDKPSCARCIKSNRVCEGYTEPTRPKRLSPVQVLPKPGHHSSSAPAAATAAAASSASAISKTSRALALTRHLSPLAPAPSLLTCGSLSSAERAAFDYFRLETAHRLPGNSWALSWPRLALRVGPHEPAVMHIAIALGSLHRAQRARGSEAAVERHRGFALGQYGRALADLRGYIADLGAEAGDAKVEVVLLVVLLFFCFEVWSADDTRAAVHLRTGLRILYEWHRSRGRIGDSYGRDSVMVDVRPDGHMGVLVQSFVRLDADLSIINKGEPCLHPAVREPVPDAFGSLEEAMVHMDALSSAVGGVYEGLTGLARAEMAADPSVDRGAITGECLSYARARTVDLSSRPEWERRMDEVRRSVRQCMSALMFVSVEPEQEAAHLLVQFHMFFLWLDTFAWRASSEMYTDKFERQFEHALGLAERYIKLHQEPSQGDAASPSSRSSGTAPSLSTASWRPVISLGTGLVAGICMIALKCRKSSVRRRCIQLLRDVNLQGVFDSEYLSSFMQTIVNLEESRARAMLSRQDSLDLHCSEVPDEARIMDIDLGEWLTEYGEAFYKLDFGILIYATRGSKGTAQAQSMYFLVQRNP